MGGETTAIGRESAPTFVGLVEALIQRSPLQRKRIVSFIGGCDAVFWNRAEEAARALSRVAEIHGENAETMIDSYLAMCQEMLREQMRFARTGRYSATAATDVDAAVYGDSNRMRRYLYGLGLSQFLWPNHYRMLDFFIDRMRKLRTARRYLEVGPGHGIYLAHALRVLQWERAVAADISPTSIRLSKEVVDALAQDVAGRCEYIVTDVAALSEHGFDCIVMCEVLEHLDDPGAALGLQHRLLDDGGHLFVTTCANCPAVDHVYLYNDADHIRRELIAAGFDIIEDLALEVDNLPQSGAGCGKVGVNYAALLRKGRKR